MKVSDVARIVDVKPNGSFFRIKYMTEKPEAKVVEATVRTGVNYSHISSVIPTLNDPNKKKRVNNYHSLIPNKVYFNTKTGKYYLYVYPTEGSNYKGEIIETGEKVTDEKPAVIKKIMIDHILEIR